MCGTDQNPLAFQAKVEKWAWDKTEAGDKTVTLSLQKYLEKLEKQKNFVGSADERKKITKALVDMRLRLQNHYTRCVQEENTEMLDGDGRVLNTEHTKICMQIPMPVYKLPDVDIQADRTLAIGKLLSMKMHWRKPPRLIPEFEEIVRTIKGISSNPDVPTTQIIIVKLIMLVS